ncbi:hypothetical protein Y1Q_0014908 [Alligator mississippiensis]|uniref:Uncharacterized protein n=1 Tax=Alligator mississippiensis TaxID=8496 RepID=A0A151N8G0_ALLMI|nr:hypothetical protein Y1Q_0014908 [Alligator mississippiensis]
MPFLLLKWITDLCSNKCFALHLSPGTRAAVLGYFTEAAKPRARGSTTVGPSEPMGNTLIRRDCQLSRARATSSSVSIQHLAPRGL